MDGMNNNQGFPGQNPGPDPNRMPEQIPSQDPSQYPNQFQGQNQGQYPNQFQGQNQGQYPNQFQGQNPGQYPNQMQGQNFNPYTGQPNTQMNPESGNTYWENQNAGQNPVGQQGTPMQETPAQFYQHYQQQMGGNPYNGPQQPMAQIEPPKKKSHKKGVAAAVVLILILAIAGTAFAFKDKILNALSLGTKSPQEYYASVEQQAINDSIDKLMTGMNNNALAEDVAYHVTADLTYDKATLDSILSGYAGMTVEDLESYIGIPLDSIGADVTVALKDSNVYEKLLLKLNQVDIISAEILMDTVAQELLMRVPELSPAYLKQSLDMSDYGVQTFDYSTYLENLKKIKPEDTADFLKRYSEIITSNMKNVELSKNEELEVGDTTETCNLLTVTIDQETLLDVVSAILEEAKDDKYILDLLPMFDISEDDYVTAIEDAADELEASYKDLTTDGEIVMEVYVSKDGKIIGRKFDIASDYGDKVAIGYAIATKGNEGEYEFYIDNGGTRLISVTGTQTEENGAYTGEATLEINAEDEGYGSYSFDISYEDMKSEIKDNKPYYYGKITVSSLLMMGMEVGLEYNVEDNIQHTELSLNMGSTSIVALDLTAEYLKDFEIPSVDGSAEVYDMYDIESYEATMDIEKFVSDLSAKLGIDLQSIIDSYLPYY